MVTHSEPDDQTARNLPVLFIVDAEPADRVAAELVLRRRFAADYRVMTADSPEAGLDALARLAQDGDEGDLVAADLRLPGMGGVEFLGQARGLHRRATRALLVAPDDCGTRIPFGALDTLQRATALGRIDFWAVKAGPRRKSCSIRRSRKHSPPGRGPITRATRSCASSASSGRRAATNCATCSRATPSRSGSTRRSPSRAVA